MAFFKTYVLYLYNTLIFVQKKDLSYHITIVVLTIVTIQYIGHTILKQVSQKSKNIKI
jgi:hypothetical protein